MTTSGEAASTVTDEWASVFSIRSLAPSAHIPAMRFSTFSNALFTRLRLKNRLIMSYRIGIAILAVSRCPS